MELRVQIGDLSQIKTDALITCVNSAGAWFGAIDSVIGRQGNFHSYIDRNRLTQGTTHIVSKKRAGPAAPWENVIFVIDDLGCPLAELVTNGLVTAANAGCKNVSLPTMRMGVMLKTRPRGRTRD